MGKNRDDRFRSLYDPKYGGGKVERPQETEQYQTRGCGDPNCAQCNPQTANRGGGVSGSEYRNSMEEIAARMMRDAAPYGISPAIMWVGPPEAKSTPSGPPTTYTTARDAVKQWIITAPDQSFEDIVGNEDALLQLRDAIEAPVKHAELYATYSMKMPKGALLSGPPGCGKTMFARAAASEMKRLYGGKTEFLCLAGPELQTMYVSETERHIKSLFTFAREYKAYHGHPLLIFIDEAETILPDRTGRVRRVAPWEESQVAAFIAEMDGVQESGAFILLASNRPEVIDQAVLRDGRCDFKIIVKRPTREACEMILTKNFANTYVLDVATLPQLVFAALESLYDPHRVLIEAHAFRLRLKDEGHEISLENLRVETRDKHFLLEHIISGAMAASIPARATRFAFNRDKAGGPITGVTVSDVVRAVDTLFEENKTLDHQFAMQEFQEEFLAELNKAEKEIKK